MFDPKITIGDNLALHSFHVFGATGYLLGVILGVWLAHATHLAIWPVILCALTGAGVLFGMTYLYKVLTGREDLVYYQHEIAILLCCLGLLALLKLSVLPYLDITLMGIGVFLVFGRVGCFSVGCCHGRIGRIGVKYTEAHVAEGFHRHFAGIPIFPIQLVESACVLVIVMTGVAEILNHRAPGTALLIYTVVYGAVRFTLEYFRGDTERPYWFGFSEAQWTTFAIFALSVILSLYGLLPQYWWHLWALPAVVFAMAVTVIVRRLRSVPTHELLHPRHVLELAEDIEILENHVAANGYVLMLRTTLGLNLSRGILADKENLTVHYTFSGEGKGEEKTGLQLNERAAKILGKLVQTLKHPSVPFEVVAGQSGIFHIVFTWQNIHPPTPPSSEALKLRRDLRYTHN